MSIKDIAFKQEFLEREELEARIKIFSLCQVELLEDCRKDRELKCVDVAAATGRSRQQYCRLRTHPEARSNGSLLRACYGIGVAPSEVYSILAPVWRCLFHNEGAVHNDNPRLLITKDNYPQLYKALQLHRDIFRELLGEAGE